VEERKESEYCRGKREGRRKRRRRDERIVAGEDGMVGARGISCVW